LVQSPTYGKSTICVGFAVVCGADLLWCRARPTENRQIQVYRDEKTIRKHINNVFAEDELDRE
jgi:hypothetical protein